MVDDKTKVRSTGGEKNTNVFICFDNIFQLITGSYFWGFLTAIDTAHVWKILAMEYFIMESSICLPATHEVIIQPIQ